MFVAFINPVLINLSAGISEEEYEAQLSELVVRNDIDQVMELIGQRTINAEILGRLVVIAASLGTFEMLQELLSYHEEISVEHRGEAIAGAAFKGDMEKIEFLLPEGTFIHDEDRGEAIVEASKFSNMNVIDYLLAPAYVEIDATYIGQAIEYLADNQSAEAIESLLGRGFQISRESRQESIVTAALYEDIDTLNILFITDPNFSFDGPVKESIIQRLQIEINNNLNNVELLQEILALIEVKPVLIM